MSYKNIIKQEQDLEQSFDDIIGEEKEIPVSIDKSINSFGINQAPELSQELSEISESIRFMAKNLEQKQKAPLEDNSSLTIHDVHKMFSVNRFGKNKEEGPRNFYDHVESINTKEIFLAQLMVNNKKDIASIGDIREELKLLDQDHGAKRVVGTVTDLNKVGYDLMKKTHEREVRLSQGNPELALQHSLERSYYQYRVSLDEPKASFEERKEHQADRKQKVLQNTSIYLENNPEFREVMRIEKSLVENSANSSKWKKGLRDFHEANIRNENDQFEAEKQMLSMQNWNLKNTPADEKQTLTKHIKTEQAVFYYKKQEFLYHKEPNTKNFDRLEAAKETMFATVKEYEKHLAKSEVKNKNNVEPSLEKDELKPRTIHQVKEELEAAHKDYATIVGKGSLNNMAEAFSHMKHLEKEFQSMQAKHQFPVTQEQQEILDGLKNYKTRLSENISKMQSSHKQK